MGQAKNRGTLEDRRKAPLGDAWRNERNAIDVPRPVRVAPAIPLDAMRRSVSRGESAAIMAAMAGIALGARMRRR